MANNPPFTDAKPPVGHNETTEKQIGWDVKEPKILPETHAQGRVDLRVKDFDYLLEQKGTNVCVFRSLYCPNVKSADGSEHQIDCQLCNGSGFIDVFPIVCKAFVQNQELEKVAGQIGDHDGNTVLMTFPIGVELQYFTRIEFKDYTEIYYQRVMRNHGTNTDILKYKACRVNVVVDQNGVYYYQEQDFSLDQNGNLTWLTLGTSRKPADYVVYSIHYETHVQFRAVRAMHVTRFTQYRNDQGIEHIKMNEQWMCTKEFLLRRKDINTKQDLKEGPYDNHTNTTGDNT